MDSKIKNSRLANKKNKLTVELDLTREELSNIKDLFHAAQNDVCTNAEMTYYVEELKSRLLAVKERLKKLTFLLNEAKNAANEEYVSVIMKKRIVKEQEEELLELELDLENEKVCLEKKTEKANMLEEMQDMWTQINTLEIEKLNLKEESMKRQQQIEELKKNLEICQDEKERLKKLLDEKNDKLLEFEDRLKSAKDIELATTSQSKKGYCKNTSEDEATSKQRTTRRPPKKENSRTPKDASVIKHNKSARLAGLPPPPSEPLPERRRNVPRRKLNEADECPQDILPLQNTRILRPRRK